MRYYYFRYDNKLLINKQNVNINKQIINNVNNKINKLLIKNLTITKKMI